MRRLPLHILTLGACLWAGLAVHVQAQAQEGLPDPTRPPAAFHAPQGADGGAALSSEPQVQSILVSLSPGGRRIAVIDGKTLREGARLGDAVVVAIEPTQVILRRDGQRQVLKLYRPAARVAGI